MEEEKMFELLTSVKYMVKSDPAQARTALTSHPNLAYALMKEMVVLDVLDPEVLTKTLQAATGVPPIPGQSYPTPTQPQLQQGYPPNNVPLLYPPPSASSAPSSTPSYPTPPAPGPAYQAAPPSVSTYPVPTSILSYPPTSTPTYPPTYPSQSVPPPQPPALSIPPHMYQARQQQQQAPQPPPQAQPLLQSRVPPASVPPPPTGAVATGLAPEQQAMIQRLALLTPDQIAALPPADRAALLELRRTLGLA